MVSFSRLKTEPDMRTMSRTHIHSKDRGAGKKLLGIQGPA